MAVKSLKILHIISQRPDSTGSGIYLQGMLREAAARGHTNHLLAGVQAGREPRLDCIPRDRLTFVTFNGDIPFQIVGMSDAMPYASMRFCDLTPEQLTAYEDVFGSRLRHVAAHFRPDIVHSHHLWLLSSLARWVLPHLPMVTTCHGSDLRQIQRCAHLTERVVGGCRGLDAVMALTQAQKSEIASRYAIPEGRIDVVGAGYDEALFAPGEKPSQAPVQLVYAGKLSLAKGVPWMLRALLRIDVPDWRLHLVGGGSGIEKQACQDLARDSNGRIRLHGTMEQSRLAAIMKTAHVFVLPSFYEGLPLVILEALACGCRIVATDLPGVSELLGDVRVDYISRVKLPALHGVDRPLPEEESAFEQRLEGALRYQIEAAAAHPTIDLSSTASKLERFTWFGIFDRVQEVYTRALRNRGGSSGEGVMPPTEWHG